MYILTLFVNVFPLLNRKYVKYRPVLSRMWDKESATVLTIVTEDETGRRAIGEGEETDLGARTRCAYNEELICKTKKKKKKNRRNNLSSFELSLMRTEVRSFVSPRLEIWFTSASKSFSSCIFESETVDYETDEISIVSTDDNIQGKKCTVVCIHGISLNAMREIAVAVLCC